MKEGRWCDGVAARTLSTGERAGRKISGGRNDTKKGCSRYRRSTDAFQTVKRKTQDGRGVRNGLPLERSRNEQCSRWNVSEATKGTFVRVYGQRIDSADKRFPAKRGHSLPPGSFFPGSRPRIGRYLSQAFASKMPVANFQALGDPLLQLLPFFSLTSFEQSLNPVNSAITATFGKGAKVYSRMGKETACIGKSWL